MTRAHTVAIPKALRGTAMLCHRRRKKKKAIKSETRGFLLLNEYDNAATTTIITAAAVLLLPSVRLVTKADVRVDEDRPTRQTIIYNELMPYSSTIRAVE